VARGLLVTAYVRLRQSVTAFELAAAYGAAYDGSPFVRLLGEGRCPEIRGVVRTNRCDLGWVVDEAGRSAVLLAAIDNLLKGAAGQAVQNLNLMHDRPEAEGLPA
jgi:N-acetyl-gamma-glutamyl-phosphate reductase